MLKIRKLDRFIVLSFLQPFAATFFISLVVLLLQHLWKYIDDLAGKGLEWYVILEFLFYSAANLIPLALPLAILLASIMTFGSLGERYELVSIKSAGIPLRRVIRPLFIFMIGVSGFALWFSLEVVPVANFKWGALYYDLMQQKPAFDLKEGVFYNGIEDYSIKVGRKSKDGTRVYDVIIYDHSKGRGNTTVVLAESGEIIQSDDQRYMIFNLYNGKRYEEMINQPDYYRRHQFNTMSFGKERIVFDLSSFQLTRTEEDLFKDFWRYRKLPAIERGMDSLWRTILTKEVLLRRQYYGSLHFSDTLSLAHSDLPVALQLDTLLARGAQKTMINQALNLARTGLNYIEFTKNEIQPVSYLLARYKIVWWQKFTLSASCLVLFFIGAPLGAIVRRGGFGLPVVIAILFFLLFFVLNMMGEKMVRELVIDPALGMWMSSIILTPIGIWLTVKATRDSALFNRDAYLRFFKRINPFAHRKT